MKLDEAIESLKKELEYYRIIKKFYDGIDKCLEYRWEMIDALETVLKEVDGNRID